MGAWNYKELRRHIGHDVSVVNYGVVGEAPANVAVECNDCSEVLFSYDKPCEHEYGEKHFDRGTEQEIGHCIHCGEWIWIDTGISETKQFEKAEAEEREE